jgi:hypothetical protein
VSAVSRRCHIAAVVAAAWLAHGCGGRPVDPIRQRSGDAAVAGGDARADSQSASSCPGMVSVSPQPVGWCAGEVSLSGITPLDPFCPTELRADVAIGDCARSLTLAIADGDGAGTAPYKRIQFGAILFDRARRSWTGTYQVGAILSSRSTGNSKTTITTLNSTVEILMADDPYDIDGGLADTSNPPAGAVDVRFTVEGPTDTFSGTMSVRYCYWTLCV